MATLFISDLHLDASRPRVTEYFLDFLKKQAATADALYILGDLFEVWIGDDDPDEHNRQVIEALRTFTTRVPQCFIARGNRDVMLGRRFCRETGTQLLDETTIVDLYGTSVLISHGDELCTDDVAYQRFRTQARNPTWRGIFIALPLFARRYVAARLRRTSQKQTALKAPEITDVNQEAVEHAFYEKRVATMIHGHTHRPGIHQFEMLSRQRTRIVLGDWYEQGSVLIWEPEGYRLETLAFVETGDQSSTSAVD